MIEANRMQAVVEVTTTCRSQEAARKLADLLIEARLAACAQIVGPIESVYRWKEKIEHDSEWQCTIKSAVHLKLRLIEFIQAHHDYEVPQLLVSTVEASDSYAEWVMSEVSEP